MKTITVKAEDDFDADLTRLARSLKMTKSGVIRAAVINYKKQVEREALARRIRDASLRTRDMTMASNEDLDAAAADGL